MPSGKSSQMFEKHWLDECFLSFILSWLVRKQTRNNVFDTNLRCSCTARLVEILALVAGSAGISLLERFISRLKSGHFLFAGQVWLRGSFGTTRRNNSFPPHGVHSIFEPACVSKRGRCVFSLLFFLFFLH